MKAVQEQVQTWLGDYGYGAVAPALLIDPVGVPWAWIFLMLLAEEAGLSIILMLLGGCAVLSLFDWLLYALGWFGGRRLVARLGSRWPKFAEAAHAAEISVRERGALAVCAGRFLPVVGRYVGLGAGLASVPPLKFAVYDAIGVALSVIGFGLLAHFIGRKTVDQPWFPTALSLVFIGGTVLASLFLVWGIWQARKSKAAPSA